MYYIVLVQLLSTHADNKQYGRYKYRDNLITCKEKDIKSNISQLEFLIYFTPTSH